MKQGPSGVSEEKSVAAQDGGQPLRRGRVVRIELPGVRRGRRGGRESGEEEEEDEMKELEKRIENAGLPEHALKAAQKELKVDSLSCVFDDLHQLKPSINRGSRVFLCSFQNMLCPGIYTHSHSHTLTLSSSPWLVRNYLETLLDLPWSSSTTDSIDLHAARLTLEADHYGLQPVS